MCGLRFNFVLIFRCDLRVRHACLISWFSENILSSLLPLCYIGCKSGVQNLLHNAKAVMLVLELGYFFVHANNTMVKEILHIIVANIQHFISAVNL